MMIPMKSAMHMAAPCLLAFALASCGNSSGPSLAGNQPVGTGPFDSRGNYVDDWADNPAKWRQDTTRPSRITTTPEPVMPVIDDLPVIASVDQPPPDAMPLTVSVSTPPRIPSRPATQTVQAKPKPKPAATAAKPAAKPVAKKPAPKKPAASQHMVKKGDTLYGIARRYNTTVANIQRANKISGSIIHPGKSLTIPR